MMDEHTVVALARALGFSPARVAELTRAVDDQLASLAPLWEADVAGLEPVTDPLAGEEES